VYSYLAPPAVMPAAASSGVGISGDARFLFLPYGAVPFFNVYKKRADDTFALMPLQLAPPSGASTTSAFSADGSTIVLANAPPPFMGTFKAIAPYNKVTHFGLPAPSLTQVEGSPVDSLFWVRAKDKDFE
jgi:hypothetical protein